MKINILEWLRSNRGETLATFGEARLVKELDGKIRLVGGTPEDRRAAREWWARFPNKGRLAAAP